MKSKIKAIPSWAKDSQVQGQEWQKLSTHTCNAFFFLRKINLFALSYFDKIIMQLDTHYSVCSKQIERAKQCTWKACLEKTASIYYKPEVFDAPSGGNTSKSPKWRFMWKPGIDPHLAFWKNSKRPGTTTSTTTACPSSKTQKHQQPPLCVDNSKSYELSFILNAEFTSFAQAIWSWCI